MKYVFGEPIVREFCPVIDGAPVLVPAQTPTIYLFDEKPDQTTALAGTGSIGTVSTWTTGTASPYACVYTIPAIDDPDQTSSTRTATYWESILFILEVGEQQQVVVRAFEVERALATEASPGTTIQDLKAIWPGISNYLSDVQLEAQIPIAEWTVKQSLKAKGYEWGKLSGLEDLRFPIAYKTIEEAARCQRKAPDDRFALLVEDAKELFNTAMTNTILYYDRQAVGAASEVAKPGTSFIFTLR